MNKNRNGAINFASSARTSLSQDKIFIPSCNEMLNIAYGFTETSANSNTRALYCTNYSKNHNEWYDDFFVRSPGSDADKPAVAYVNNDGKLINYDRWVNSPDPCCSSALNLNLKSVIFASKAAESDQSDAKEAEFEKFELPTGHENEYKLTIIDSTHEKFAVENKPESLTKIQGNDTDIIIGYSGAKTGDNEYVSAILTQENTADEIIFDETKYYGKIAKNSESGKTTIKLSNDLEPGDYKIKIFAEQCNGPHETNWASATQDINLKLLRAPKITDFKILPQAQRQGYEKEVAVTLDGKNFDTADKLKINFIDKNENTVLQKEKNMTLATEITISFTDREISNLPIGRKKFDRRIQRKILSK